MWNYVRRYKIICNNSLINEKFDSIPHDMATNQSEFTVFQRNCIKTQIKTHESRVNDLIKELLENVLDLRVFDISTSYPLDLFVRESVQEANPDFVIMHWQQKWFVTIIVVDQKKKKMLNHKKDKSEAQAIAKSIAVAQQQNWPNDLIVYFFRVCGTEVTAYKSLYGFEFLDLVRKGNRRNEPHIIFKFAPKTFKTIHEGLDLINPNDRKEIVQFFCAIQEYYKDKLK